MNFRTTLILLVLTALVGGYIWFFEQDPKPDPATAGQVQVYEDKFEAKDIQKLEITSQGTTTVLERADEARWNLASTPGARADKVQADAVADSLTELKSSRKLPTSADLASFGLEKPAAQISFSLKGQGSPRVLLLGDKFMDSESIFAKRADAPDLFLIPASLLTQVQKVPTDWRDKGLTSVVATEVQALEIEREGGRLAFEKQGERWMMTQPRNLPASKDEVEGLIRDASSLRVESFAKDNVTPEDLKGYGLDTPRFTMKLRTGPEAWTQILFGAAEPSTEPPPAPDASGVPPYTPPQKVYAKLANENSVGVVMGGILDKLGKRPEDFQFLQTFHTQQWQVQKAEIRLEGANLVLEKDAQGEWKILEPANLTVDYSKASAVLSELFTVRFDGLAPEGAQLEEKARIVITPEKKGEEAVPAEVLRIGAVGPDGTRLVQREGESWVYVLQDSGLTPFRTALQEVLTPPTPVSAAPADAPTAAVPAAGAP